MASWIYFVIVAVVAIAAYAMQPRPPKQKRPSLDDFSIPRVEQGAPIPMIFGTITMTGPMVVWYGDLLVETETEDGVRTRKFYMGLHFIICHGPVDDFIAIIVGDRLAWDDGLTASGTITLAQGSLFGGKRQSGGIAGDVDVMFGEPTQGANAYLTATQGSPQPAYRGVVSAVCNQCYVSANATHVEPWAFKLGRTEAGWHQDTCWYPETVSIALPAPETQYVDESDYAAIGSSETGSGVEIRTAYPKFGNGSLYCTGGGVAFDNDDSRFDLGNNEFTVECWIRPESLGATRFFLTHSDSGTSLTTSFELYCEASTIRAAVFWGTNRHDLNGVTTVSLDTYVHVSLTRSGNVFALHVGGNLEDSWDSGGITLNSVSYPLVVGKLGDYPPTPPYTGDIDAVRVTNGTARYSVAADFTPPATAFPDNVGADSDWGDVVLLANFDAPVVSMAMNPAHIIYQVITDPRGMGLPAAMIDTDSFETAADTFKAEGLGLCLKWMQSEKVEDFMRHICDHAACILRVSPRTGKFQLKPLRYDYDPDALSVYGEAEIVSMERWERVGYGELVGEVVLGYIDVDTNKQGSVTHHNIAVIQSQSGVVTESVELPGIPTEALAHRVCMRELKARSVPLARAKFKTTRETWELLPGDPFKVSWAKLGLTEVIMRVLSISTGTLTDGAITVEAVEDVFGMPASTYAADQSSGWVTPIIVDPEESGDFVRMEETGEITRRESTGIIRITG